MVRLYRPGAEVFNSDWQFPEAKPGELNVGFGSRAASNDRYRRLGWTAAFGPEADVAKRAAKQPFYGAIDPI